jgi:hypothetical protein
MEFEMPVSIPESASGQLQTAKVGVVEGVLYRFFLAQARKKYQ